MKNADIRLWGCGDKKQHPERCPYGIMRFDDETGKITMYRSTEFEQQWLNGKI